MGQFYRVIWDEEGNRRVFDYGGKLMEFSSMYNYNFSLLVDHIAKIKKPVRLAIMGDYANKELVYNDDSLSKEMIAELYQEAWDSDDTDEINTDSAAPVHRYIINHTKHLYVDVVDSINLAGFLEGRDREYFRNNTIRKFMLGECLERIQGADVINPLIILTAVGNGWGIGDYCGIKSEYAGWWAWDKISVSDDYSDIPRDYARFNIAFTEFARS